MLDRRAFLQVAMSAAGVVAAPARPAAAFAAARRRAIVVGGGVAGCTAALALADAGFSVQLFEPREELACEVEALGEDPVLGRVDPRSPAAPWLPRLRAWRDGATLRAASDGAPRCRLRFEPVALRREAAVAVTQGAPATTAPASPGVRLQGRDGESVVADVAVVALARDALRRLRWDDADRDLALGPGFDGVMRDRLLVTLRTDRLRETLPVGGDTARWLESLPRGARDTHLRRHVARVRGVGADLVEIESVASLRRREWPADLGWAPPEGTPRTACGAGPAIGSALLFCDSSRTAADGLQGLVESGLAAASLLACPPSRTTGRALGAEASRC